MSSIYLITEHSNWANNCLGWYEHFDHIREIEPDIVILWLAFEYGISYNWNYLPSLLNNWKANENPKTEIFLLAPDVFNSEYAITDCLEHVHQIIFTLVNYTNVGSYHHCLYKEPNLDINHYIDKNLHAEKLFIALNRNFKLHRALLLDRIFELGLQEKCIYSAVNLKDKFKYKFFPNINKSLTDNFYDNLEPTDIPVEYSDAFIDLVTETCFEDNAFFLTEKTIRPIMMMKPFVAISCPGYHRWLKKTYNILPYNELFDYDAIDSAADVQQRIDIVLEQICALENKFKDQEQRKQLLESIKPTLIHNYNAAMNLRNFRFPIHEKLYDFFTSVEQSKHNMVVHAFNLDTVECFMELCEHPYIESQNYNLEQRDLKKH